MRQLWVWMLLMALAFVNDRCLCCLQEERSGLLEIKAWFGHAGDGSSTLQDWDKDDLNCCKWDYRVACDSTTSRVIKLYLFGVNDGALGKDLYLNASLFLPFKELEYLDLSGNQLVGGLRNQGFQGLAYGLRKLKFLYLRDNKFNDNILSSLSGFSTLESLDLSDNYFTGTIGLRALQNLTKLEELFLDGASPITTSFLRIIGSLPALRNVSLERCMLTDTLPHQGWCELKNLERLYLRQNNLKGVLPPCLGNLSSLRHLDLSDNQFEGNIASSHLSHLRQLEHLSISNNYFQVPISFGSFMNLSNLKVIVCDNNELVPASSFQAPAPKFQLSSFSASTCTSKLLSVGFPSFLRSQYDLDFVDLSHNKFIGEPFPSWLVENNTKLNRLYLRNTSIIGPLQLPQNHRPNLQTIDLSDNNIHGQVARNTCLIFPSLPHRLYSSLFWEYELSGILGSFQQSYVM